MSGIASAIGAGVSMIGGLIGAGKARRAARRQRAAAAALGKRITAFENSRQAVINPYSNVKDLSSMVSNPFENLQVATEAAEMKAREQDISLATTLDTLRATGAGAGGATALAQAASRSKSNIAASIEKQEADNSRLRAQGEQQMQQLKMQEGARVQGLEAQGRAFQFSAQEKRDMAKLNRMAGQQQNAQNQANQLAGQASAMTGQALGALGSLVGAGVGMANYKSSLGGAAGGAGGIDLGLTGPKGLMTQTNLSGFNNILNKSNNLPQVNFGSSLFMQKYGNPFASSDRRLKQDIEFLRLSPSGLKIYSFKYKNQEGVYEGVMSDEIPSYAVVKNYEGIYDGVDYSKIDVNFKQIK